MKGLKTRSHGPSRALLLRGSALNGETQTDATCRRKQTLGFVWVTWGPLVEVQPMVATHTGGACLGLGPRPPLSRTEAVLGAAERCLRWFHRNRESHEQKAGV